jgi:decaprenyl-phosphate phosphoribosyltransferase
MIALARPRQWVKNALVVAAPGAAGALGHDDVPGRVLVACVAFCLLSAGIYAFNDVRDRGEDRHHPRKRLRPVAAGDIQPREALGTGAGWVACGLIVCAAITPTLALVGAGYVALSVSYSWLWRRVVVIDLLALAGGFVLRAVAGGVAAPVGLSRWFVLVVTFVAVAIVAGKRLAELRRSRLTGGAGRRVLRQYSEPTLRAIVWSTAAGALFAYCVWAFNRPDIDGVPWRLLTVIPFALCLLRYGRLAGAGGAEAPEDVIVSDRWMMLGALSWFTLFALTVGAAG